MTSSATTIVINYVYLQYIVSYFTMTAESTSNVLVIRT